MPDQASRALRRSLYVAQDMRAGDEITRLNVRVVRPGLGLEPRHYEAVLGKHVQRDVRRGTPLTWDLIQ